MGDTKGLGERIFLPGDGDKMDMIIHQAIRQ